MRNGTSSPPSTSNQKSGANSPVSMRAMGSASKGAPGYAAVRASDRTKKASTAMKAASRPPRYDTSSSSKSSRPRRRRTSARRMTSASPETRAEATNIGAMIAVYQNPRLIWRPKIQAVMEWSRIAAGSATQASLPFHWSSRARDSGESRVPSARRLPLAARSARV